MEGAERMTIEEAGGRYNIPTKILREYESWGLCGGGEKVMGAWQYDRTDIELLSLIMTLHDAGFTNKEAEQYMRLALSDSDTSEERMKMLLKKRSGTLDEIHFRQKQLDRLDYLRFEISAEIERKEK